MTTLYIYLYCINHNDVIVIFISVEPFVPSRNLDEVYIITIYGSNVPSKPFSCYILQVSPRADHVYTQYDSSK